MVICDAIPGGRRAVSPLQVPSESLPDFTLLAQTCELEPRIGFGAPANCLTCLVSLNTNSCLLHGFLVIASLGCHATNFNEQRGLIGARRNIAAQQFLIKKTS